MNNKKSCRLISSIDLTQRFHRSGIITIVIIPFLLISFDIQTIFISPIVRLSTIPICVTKRNTAALPNPFSFLKNKVIQMKTTQCGNFRIFLPLRFCLKSIFGKFRGTKITILTFSEALNLNFRKFQLCRIAKFSQNEKIRGVLIKGSHSHQTLTPKMYLINTEFVKGSHLEFSMY